MKKLRYIWNLILSTVPKVLVLIGWAYFVFLSRPGGTSLINYIATAYDSVMTPILLKEGFFPVELLSFLVWLALLLLLEALIILVLPFAACLIVYAFCDRRKKARKDLWCEIMYDWETKRGKPHKKRMNGDDWERRESEKAEKARQKEEKRKAGSSYSSGSGYSHGSGYDYGDFNDYGSSYDYGSSGDYGGYSGSGSNGNTHGSGSTASGELQKAMDAFLLDDLNVTEEELKRIRNKLIKSFHPDMSTDTEADTKNAQKINRYYEILKKAIQK